MASHQQSHVLCSAAMQFTMTCILMCTLMHVHGSSCCSGSARLPQNQPSTSNTSTRLPVLKHNAHVLVAMATLQHAFRTQAAHVHFTQQSWHVQTIGVQTGLKHIVGKMLWHKLCTCIVACSAKHQGPLHALLPFCGLTYHQLIFSATPSFGTRDAPLARAAATISVLHHALPNGTITRILCWNTTC